jgi:SAM-dependent methyltransferase
LPRFDDGASAVVGAGYAGPAMTQPDLGDLRELFSDPTSIVKAVGSGRQRNTTPPWRRVEVRSVDLAHGRRLQITSYDEQQAHVRNVAFVDAPAVLDELLAMPFANWFVKTESEELQARVSKKGKVFIHRAPHAAVALPRYHDRVKPRRVDASDPIFTALGISDGDGVLKASRVGKFNQVQSFIDALEPVVRDLPPVVSMIDLGCGNAYLTFAAHRYLTDVLGRSVHSVGVDVKDQSRRHNEAIAETLGWTNQLTFVASAIADAEFDTEPDLVLALHACDTASDEAIARAVRHCAKRILVAPCCHHDLARQLRHQSRSTMLRYGILRERLADVLTDSLRTTILRILGYRVDVIDFVDSVHTPRNTLIRAVRTGALAASTVLDDYRETVEHWQVRPALAAMLADELAAAGLAS